MSIVRSLISKSSIFSQTVFCPHESAKPVFSNSSSLKRVFAKLRFPDVVVWTVAIGLTAETKPCFQISQA